MRRLLWLLLLIAAPVIAAPAWASPSQVLRTAEAPSPALGHPLGFALYLPPDYDAGQQALPVIYLLHGVGAGPLDWVDQGHVQATADRLISEHRLPPVLIAMPDGGPNSWYVDAPTDGSGNVATAISRDLPAFIEQTWRARRDRLGRAIAGYSMGGFGALRLALAEPDRYAAAAAMSGAFWTRVTPDTKYEDPIQHIFGGAFGRPFDAHRFIAASPMALAAAMPRATGLPAIYLTCGQQDRYHLDREQAVMAARLTEMKIPVETALIAGDHDWDTWAKALPDVLAFLGRHFGPSPKS
jgi:enterochelin esterase family protein